MRRRRVTVARPRPFASMASARLLRRERTPAPRVCNWTREQMDEWAAQEHYTGRYWIPSFAALDIQRQEDRYLREVGVDR